MVKRWHPVAWGFVVLVIAYSVLLAGQLLLGVFVATLIYLVVWLFAEFGRLDTRGAFSASRAVATATVVVLVVAYALLIAGQVLLGLLAAATVFVVAWVTSPTGPFAGE
jgi:uncharacterized membrane protein YhdT